MVFTIFEWQLLCRFLSGVVKEVFTSRNSHFYEKMIRSVMQTFFQTHMEKKLFWWNAFGYIWGQYPALTYVYELHPHNNHPKMLLKRSSAYFGSVCRMYDTSLTFYMSTASFQNDKLNSKVNLLQLTLQCVTICAQIENITTTQRQTTVTWTHRNPSKRE